MKLCQKCVLAINEAEQESGKWPGHQFGPATFLDIKQCVPDSECEFWAHKRLNESGLALVQMINMDHALIDATLFGAGEKLRLTGKFIGKISVTDK